MNAWEMTSTEWDAHMVQAGRERIEKWNRGGCRGFPPSAGIDTVAIRITLAGQAGYLLPRDAQVVMAMKYHQLAVEAAFEQGLPIPLRVLKEMPI